MVKKNFETILILLTLCNLCYSQRSKLQQVSGLLKQPEIAIDHFTDKECPSRHFDLLFDLEKYDIDEYSVVTKDDYILKSFRVKLRPRFLAELKDENKKNISQPILLVHGVEADSDVWFINEPDKTLGHRLIDMGYDVWVLNNRGNKYSRSHTNDGITKEQLYDFSFTEMGLYDLPAMYEKILSLYDNEMTKVIYIGESLGATQFFVAGADETTKNYVRSKTSKFIAIDPVVYCTDIENKYFKYLASHLGVVYKYLGFMINEEQQITCLNPNSFIVKFAETQCSWFKSFCRKLVDKSYNDLYKIVGRVLAHAVNVSAFQERNHLAQLINGDKDGNPIFRKYDHGSEEANRKFYNQGVPPEWNFDDWNTPTTLISGERDGLANTKNMEMQQKHLSESTFTHHTIPDWSHATCYQAKDPTPLFEIIDKVLQTPSEKAYEK